WLASIMVMASCVAVLFGDKIRSQSKPFLYLFQLVAAKDPVHERHQNPRYCSWITASNMLHNQRGAAAHH
ncbi:hypothetical protein ACET7Y_19635, partial [Aeromonas veronii]